MIGTPGADLHSPGSIGDVTPGTIQGTTITATTKLVVPIGSTTVPTIHGAAESDTGISFPSSQNIDFISAGDRKYVIAGDNLVGFGNTFGSIIAPASGSFGFNGRDAEIRSSGAQVILGAGGGSATERLRVSATGTRLVLPTSSAGLVAGDLWNNSGVVNIVT